MRVDIHGIGWVTPFGLGSGRPGEVLRLGPGSLPALKSRQFLDAPHPRFGRFDSYAKAGFGAIALALRGAGLDAWTHKRAIGLVVGTRRGCLEADVAYLETALPEGGALASPNLFAYTLPGTMLGEASIQFGLTGPSFVVDDSDDHLAGIRAALDVVRWGLCEIVVAGWCEVDAQILSAGPQEPCGAVFLVLTRGSDTAPWHWDGRELTYGRAPTGKISPVGTRTQRAADLAWLAHKVLMK